MQWIEMLDNACSVSKIQANELTNGVVNGCFVLLSKDLIRLFACYNDGVINLLGKTSRTFKWPVSELFYERCFFLDPFFSEKFFDMNKKNCKEALDIYKKFLERTDNVSAFLKVAEVSDQGRDDLILQSIDSNTCVLFYRSRPAWTRVTYPIWPRRQAAC